MSAEEKIEFAYKQKWMTIVSLIIMGYGFFAYALNEAVNDSPSIELKQATLSEISEHVFNWVSAAVMFCMGTLGVVVLIFRLTIESKITIYKHSVSAPGPIWSPKHRVHDLSTVISSRVFTADYNRLYEIETADSILTVTSENFDSFEHFNQFIDATKKAMC